VTSLDRVLIAIATYKRPSGLESLLRSLESCSQSRPFSVIVVDNDANASAQEVARASVLDVMYVVEPKPGIAAARNRAMDEFEKFDAIVFVDDDEYVTAGWLDRLVEQATATSAGVVIGPVQSLFPENAPKWVKNGGFIQRPSWANGALLTAGATNNTLVKASAWRAGGSPRFDDSFSATGGSDAKIFSVLLAQGVHIEFCEAAIVFEPVLEERMKLRWLIRRAYRNGIVSARIWAPRYGRMRTLGKGLLMTLHGLAGLVWMLARGRGVQSIPFNRCLNGLGAMSALTGVRVHEYKRVS
jgi:succinoglycan biosynthesis protein ExoM